jgi:hypothetical protein
MLQHILIKLAKKKKEGNSKYYVSIWLGPIAQFIYLFIYLFLLFIYSHVHTFLGHFSPLPLPVPFRPNPPHFQAEPVLHFSPVPLKSRHKQ